jgi:hypothetical protein
MERKLSWQWEKYGNCPKGKSSYRPALGYIVVFSKTKINKGSEIGRTAGSRPAPGNTRPYPGLVSEVFTQGSPPALPPFTTC